MNLVAKLGQNWFFLQLVDIFTILDLTSAFSVIIPGVVLLSLIKGVKIASLRNITIMLSAFAILHGFYHLSYLINLFAYAPYIDLATALILVLLGMYYSESRSRFIIFAYPTRDGGLSRPDSSCNSIHLICKACAQV